MAITNIGVAFAGDAEDPTARSGSPYGVMVGLRSLGFTPKALKATLPKSVDRGIAGIDAIAHLVSRKRIPNMTVAKLAYSGAHLARLTSLSRSAALRSHRNLKQFDGVIALGSGYEIPKGIPYVIYDDMTVVQAVELQYPAWMAMRESDRQFRIEQQQRIYGNAVMCCMETSWGKESALEDYHIPASKVTVVGAGTHDEPRQVDRDWTVPNFLFIGLDWNRKNGPRVLESFERIRLAFPNATLNVVGGHPQIEQVGVNFYGRLHRDIDSELTLLTKLYDQATCFVMPSVHEPGGVVLLEAAAAGIGSIAGCRGGSRDFVGDAGIVVDPYSIDEIYEAMFQFCDPRVAQERGRKSALRSSLFTWDQVAGRILKSLDGSSNTANPLPIVDL